MHCILWYGIIPYECILPLFPAVDALHVGSSIATICTKYDTKSTIELNIYM